MSDLTPPYALSPNRRLDHARLVVSIDGNGPQTAFSPEYVDLCRAVLDCAANHGDETEAILDALYPGDESCECGAIVITGHWLSERVEGGTVVHYRRSSETPCEDDEETP